MMHQATDAYQQGRVPEAIDLYKKVIARRADTEDAYRYLAFVYWRTGQPHDAIATLESALKHGVTQGEVRIKLGEYLSEIGQAGRAIELLQDAAGEDPDALLALGIAYGDGGRGADAIATFKRILDVDPTNGLAYENIGTVQLRAHDLAAAEASLRQALSIDPTLPGAYTALGAILSQTGRTAQAIDAWKRAVSLDSTEYDALYNLTVVLVDSHRLDEARTYGERYIATAPPALHAADIAAIRKLLDGGRL